jgi:hypothetical protein
VSLKRALESLPTDRATEAGLMGLLTFFAGHGGAWEPLERVASVTALDRRLVDELLGSLVEGFVLDFHDDPPRYRYTPDRALEFEVRAFVRRARSHAELLQGNVERFRTRYGR